MSSTKARNVRALGHKKARLFASLIGLPSDYQNDSKAKKDVIDNNGDSHSVKSGDYWQIFLYSKNRIDKDPSFQAMNGIGQLILKCLNCFPEDRKEYLKNKTIYKEKLAIPMIELKEKLKEKYRLEAFLSKAIFNGGEVQYFTINEKDTDLFLVFYYKDVLSILKNNIEVKNSKATRKGQFDNQKVLFKNNDKNVGELELRNDSDAHYREIKLRFTGVKITSLLKEKITNYKQKDKIKIYGQAIKKFKL